MIGFVIPSYDRADNLRLVLQGLEQQTEQEFAVVVCDDGSTDDTEEVVASFAGSLSIVYCWRARDGYDPGAVRNKGVRYLPRAVTHIWFLDSDVILSPGAVEHALTKHLGPHPEVVVAGRYDWLRPDVRRAPFEGQFAADHRSKWDCDEIVRCSGAALTGNLIVPLDIFLKTGGFDPNLKGMRAEDCEFGYNLRSKGYMMVMCEHIVGYHLCHSPVLASEESVRGVKEGIQYIHDKYKGRNGKLEQEMGESRDLG